MVVSQAVKTSRSTEAVSQRHRCGRPGCTSSGFARRSDLKRHDRIHTQLRPYRCEWSGCKKAFNQKGQLKTHTNTHTGEKPHQCEICPKKFGDPASRTRHKREAHGEQGTNQCPACNSKIKRLRSFYKHLRDKHGIDWSSDVNGERPAQGGVVVLTEGMRAVPRQSLRRRGAYSAPSFDAQEWEAGDGPSLSIVRNDGPSHHPRTSHVMPDTLELGRSSATYPLWQQTSREVSLSQEVGSTYSPGSRSTASSSSVSPSPYGFREFSPVDSLSGSMLSSESSPHVLQPVSDAEDHAEPVHSHPRRYNTSFPLERQLHSQNLRTWRLEKIQTGGMTVPIDPALLSFLHASPDPRE